MVNNSHPLWRQERCEWCKAGDFIADGRRHFRHHTDRIGYYLTGYCTAPTEAEYIAELTACIAELEKDKARLDFLISTGYQVLDTGPYWMVFDGEESVSKIEASAARDAIDDAMSRQNKPQESM